MDNKEFDKYICEKYPDIFRERHLPMSETAMCWGICFDAGWNVIFEEMIELLDFIQKTHQVEIIAKQVKEKLATMTFYYNPKNNDPCRGEVDINVLKIISAIVNQFSIKSSYTCEICGGYGNLCITGRGYRKTLCKKHEQELGFKIYKDDMI